MQPAPVFGSLELIAELHPMRWWARKAMLLQLAQSDTTALLDGEGRVLAVIGILPLPPERRGETLLEMWFVVRPTAAPVMLKLARVCRLMLSRLGDSGPYGGNVRIRACVAEGHAPGQRMAAIAGLRMAGVVDGLEHWEGPEWVISSRRSSGRSPAA